MKIAITGLPLSGKTTIFNALAGEHSAGKEEERKKQNVVTIKVPDPRVDALAEIFQPKKITYADIVCVDAGNLVEPGSDRKTDSSHFQTIRGSDALCLVVADYLDDVSVVKDAKKIIEEMTVTDLIGIENRLEKIEKQYQSTKKRELGEEVDILKVCRGILEEGTLLAGSGLDEGQKVQVRGFQFLSLKPTLWVLNIGEKDIPHADRRAADFGKEIPSAGKVIPICGKAEMEIAELEPEERPAFMRELGIAEPGLSKLIRASYEIMGLISFLTAGEKEVRAWTIPRDTRAQAAAGAIHSDIERGFIRAETISYNAFMESKSMAAAKTKGQLRLEGKDYIVKDGDIITFRFNVSH